MTKLSTLFVAATLVTGASFSASAAQGSESSNFYYWLHPKLGHVKVDKTTHAMIKSVRVSDRGEATYSGPMLGDAIKGATLSNNTEARSSSGYVSERGEAAYSGPMPRTSVQQAADTDTRALGGSAGTPLSRAQVLNDLKEFQRNPVTADGYRFINGEIGYVRVGPKSSL